MHKEQHAYINENAYNDEPKVLLFSTCLGLYSS